MQGKINGIVDVIRQVLRVDRVLCLEEIYAEVRTRLDLTSEQKEITYGRPNFEHTVRSILSDLVQRGEVIRVDRGKYMKARPNHSKT